jgi:hypothetical protein
MKQDTQQVRTPEPFASVHVPEPRPRGIDQPVTGPVARGYEAVASLASAAAALNQIWESSKTRRPSEETP